MTNHRTITVAALQDAFETWNLQDNIDRVVAAARQAASQGAQVILPPELFQGPYFCKEERAEFFASAYPAMEHPAVVAMQQVARETGTVIPTSIFERDGQHYYNSLVTIDADGSILGLYRKSHIPDGPGYEEKFYFRAGNTGFKVWQTRFGCLGVGICWDQWFPECARSMVLMGAEVLLYPTAIGSEPQEPNLDTRPMWMRAMLGHAVCNVVPVVAANRIGNEDGQKFYGTSFICDHRGELLTQGAIDQPEILMATLDLTQTALDRASFGFFRDRRPEFYGALTESA